MKKLCVIALLLMAMGTFASFAKDKEWKSVDAATLRLINKGWTDTNKPYTRLKAEMQPRVNEQLWTLAQESAGIGVRFATDSKNIGVDYHLMFNSHMNHMADSGIKGCDLYVWEGDSAWRHVNTVRPVIKESDPKHVTATLLENFDGNMHEYIIYFPLYDGVEDFYVTIDPVAQINHGTTDLISPNKRIVAYGTSIMQGGCASRTGMAYTNIIGRELNAEVINLGFSGQGKMDKAMAEALASIEDVDVFLLDPVPNCTEMQCDTLTYDFVNTLRKACPNAKIVMVEGPMYPYSRYNSYFKNYLPKKNAAYRRNFDRLKREDSHNLFYVTSKNLDGVEDDGTVDGIHLTDLGMRHYADKLVPFLRDVMGK